MSLVTRHYLLFYNLIFMRILGPGRQRDRSYRFQGPGDACRRPSPLIFPHPVPAPHEIGAFVIEAHPLIVRSPGRILRGPPFLHLCPAVGTGRFLVHGLLLHCRSKIPPAPLCKGGRCMGGKKRTKSSGFVPEDLVLGLPVTSQANIFCSFMIFFLDRHEKNHDRPKARCAHFAKGTSRTSMGTAIMRWIT